MSIAASRWCYIHLIELMKNLKADIYLNAVGWSMCWNTDVCCGTNSKNHSFLVRPVSRKILTVFNHPVLL
jgi:hypothetical protein